MNEWVSSCGASFPPCNNKVHDPKPILTAGNTSSLHNQSSHQESLLAAGLGGGCLDEAIVSRGATNGAELDSPMSKTLSYCCNYQF